VTRDRLMVEYHRWYPQYNFAEHKGYGTPEHLRLLREHGPCAIHRRSFAPVQQLCVGDARKLCSSVDQSESPLDRCATDADW
jgi:ribonuclease HII